MKVKVSLAIAWYIANYPIIMIKIYCIPELDLAQWKEIPPKLKNGNFGPPGESGSSLPNGQHFPS